MGQSGLEACGGQRALEACGPRSKGGPVYNLVVDFKRFEDSNHTLPNFRNILVYEHNIAMNLP